MSDHLSHSTYKQQCYFAGAMRTQIEGNVRTPRGIENTDGMYQFKRNNPIQEYNNKMPFEFKWNQGKACQINPSKYGYAQAANSMLKTINSNLEDIKDWAILDSGVTSHFLVTDASATGISVATNPITVTIPDGTRLTSTHKENSTFHYCPKQQELDTSSQVCCHTHLYLLSYYATQDAEWYSKNGELALQSRTEEKLSSKEKSALAQVCG